MRSNEILNLRWDQVNLEDGKILLSSEQTKNKSPRMIFLTGELLQVLMIARETRNQAYSHCPWVCQKDGEWLQSFKKSWKTALKLVGLEGGFSMTSGEQPFAIWFGLESQKK